MTRDEQNEIEDRIGGDQRDPPSVCCVCEQPIRYYGNTVLCVEPGCDEPMHIACGKVMECSECHTQPYCRNHMGMGRYLDLCRRCDLAARLVDDLDSPASSVRVADAPGAGDAGAAEDGPLPSSQEEQQ